MVLVPSLLVIVFWLVEFGHLRRPASEPEVSAREEAAVWNPQVESEISTYNYLWLVRASNVASVVSMVTFAGPQHLYSENDRDSLIVF